jgi:hypothetical protein
VNSRTDPGRWTVEPYDAQPVSDQDRLYIIQDAGSNFYIELEGNGVAQFTARGNEDEATLMSYDRMKAFMAIWAVKYPGRFRATPYGVYKQKLASPLNEGEEEQKEEGGFMSETAIVPVGVQFVDVRFEDSGADNTTFRVYKPVGEVKEGDHLVVQLTDKKLGIGKVVYVYGQEELYGLLTAKSGTIRYAIQKVDYGAHEKIVQAVAEKRQLRVQLNQMAKRVQERKLLEEILKDEPEAKALLERKAELDEF